jgi:hypothetical protein
MKILELKNKNRGHNAIGIKVTTYTDSDLTIINLPKIESFLTKTNKTLLPVLGDILIIYKTENELYIGLKVKYWHHKGRILTQSEVYDKHLKKNPDLTFIDFLKNSGEYKEIKENDYILQIDDIGQFAYDTAENVEKVFNITEKDIKL